MKTIIGISGLKGSGKSTLANILREKYNFVEYAFADPLKKGIIEMFKLRTEQLYGTLEDKETIDDFWQVSPRTLMQVIGTDLFRNYLPTRLPQLKDIWIRGMEKKIMESPYDKIVISDCRFLDEACLIRNLGGTIIHLNRPSIVALDTHESESCLFESDHTIFNSGTIQDLESKINDLLKK